MATDSIVRSADLTRWLTEMSLLETDGSIRVEINREAFPAWFLQTALRAAG